MADHGTTSRSDDTGNIVDPLPQDNNREVSVKSLKRKMNVGQSQTRKNKLARIGAQDLNSVGGSGDDVELDQNSQCSQKT